MDYAILFFILTGLTALTFWVMFELKKMPYLSSAHKAEVFELLKTLKAKAILGTTGDEQDSWAEISTSKGVYISLGFRWEEQQWVYCITVHADQSATISQQLLNFAKRALGLESAKEGWFSGVTNDGCVNEDLLLSSDEHVEWLRKPVVFPPG